MVESDLPTAAFITDVGLYTLSQSMRVLCQKWTEVNISKIYLPGSKFALTLIDFWLKFFGTFLYKIDDI